MPNATETLDARIFDALELLELDADGNAAIAVNADDLVAIIDALEIAARATGESIDAEPEVFSPAYRARRRGLLEQIGVAE